MKSKNLLLVTISLFIGSLISGGVAFAVPGFFAQGGSSFLENATLGTNDNFPLIIETNNTERARFDTSGGFGVGSQFQVSSSGVVTSGTWNGLSVAFTYKQLSRGEIDIPDGITAASVTHNLGTTPTQVTLTWKGLTVPASVQASSAYLQWSLPTATGFTVNISHALSNRPTISWLAIP